MRDHRAEEDRPRLCFEKRRDETRNLPRSPEIRDVEQLLTGRAHLLAFGGTGPAAGLTTSCQDSPCSRPGGSEWAVVSTEMTTSGLENGQRPA